MGSLYKLILISNLQPGRQPSYRRQWCYPGQNLRDGDEVYVMPSHPALNSPCHHMRSLYQTQPGGHRFELASSLVLLFTDRMEEEGATRDVDIKQRYLPIPRSNLGLHDFESTALFELAENPESEINVGDQFPRELCQPRLFGINQQYTLHCVEHFAFVAGWPVVRIG